MKKKPATKIEVMIQLFVEEEDALLKGIENILGGESRESMIKRLLREIGERNGK